MSEQNQNAQQQAQDDQALQQARDFFGQSMGRIKGQMQSDSAQLQSYMQQLPEESQAQIRQMTDSYSQFEGTINQAAQDAGVQDSLEESAEQARQNADQASGQDPTDVAAQQAQDVAGQAQEVAGGAVDKAGEVTDQAQDAADQVGQVTDGVQDTVGGLTGDQQQAQEEEGDEQGDEGSLGGATGQARDSGRTGYRSSAGRCGTGYGSGRAGGGPGAGRRRWTPRRRAGRRPVGRAGAGRLLLQRQRRGYGRKRQDPQGYSRATPQPGDPPFPNQRHDHPGVRRHRRVLRARRGNPARGSARVARGAHGFGSRRSPAPSICGPGTR